MSVIQKIRDKYARWAVVAIALALLGFILMDAFAGRSSLFGDSRETTVGKVNGKVIDAQQFALKIQDYEKSSGTQGEYRTQQAINDVWNQEVTNLLLQEQYNELGLLVSDKELRDILYGANPPQDLRQRFSDPNTGVYNALQAQQAINQVSKTGSPEERAQLNQYINAIENQRLMEKYTSLLINTTYAPKWFLEKRNADNSMIAKISYVGVPYASIQDSAVKVTDQEIENYIKEHKKEFELKEETRSVNYVAFSAAPSAADSAKAKSQLLSHKQEFDTASNYEDLAKKTGSIMGFYDSYISEKNIQNPNKDSILKAPTGVVAGPFVDNGVFVLAKVLGVKNLPDTVKVRHILVATMQQNPQTGENVQVRDDATAKKLIDSIQGLLNAGQLFDSLVVKYSDDQGSKNSGGVYENVFTGQMVAPFNDFIFNNPVGATGIVKTNFGYHLVEVLSQKGSSPAYKIAYLTEDIVPSDETDNLANNNANMFAGNATDVKSFDDTWEKNWKAKGINKLVAADLKPIDFNIIGMQGSARSLVKKIFEADKGEVIGPESIRAEGGHTTYVVAVVTDIEKEGLPSANKVRMVVEPVLRNKKKAAEIRKNMGTVTDLNQLSAKVAQPVQTVDSMTFAGGGPLAFESKIVGASFNPALKGKVSEPIAGQSGVFVIRVESVGTTSVPAASVEEQRKMIEMQARQSFRSPVAALQKAADIKDYRSRFY